MCVHASVQAEAHIKGQRSACGSSVLPCGSQGLDSGLQAGELSHWAVLLAPGLSSWKLKWTVEPLIKALVLPAVLGIVVFLLAVLILWMVFCRAPVHPEWPQNQLLPWLWHAVDDCIMLQSHSSWSKVSSCFPSCGPVMTNLEFIVSHESVGYGVCAYFTWAMCLHSG